jgi:AraC-like DNA-binding protein
VRKIENLDIGHVKRGFDNNFKIKISEDFDDKSIETDFPHRHNFYTVCLVIKGNGVHVIDFEKIDIKPDRLFFIKPEQIHFWQISPRSKLAIIQFSVDYLARLFNPDSIPAIHSALKQYIDLQTEESGLIYSIINKIDTENNKNDLNSDKIIQAQIFIILAEIERLSRIETVQKSKGNKIEILNNFKRLLNANYKEITTISGYAKLLSITPNWLNIIIKETTGFTANELMHKRILLEAKRLLINKNTDITQIAYELGFKDASYFARFFKKSTGISPSGFRSSIYKMYQHHNE